MVYALSMGLPDYYLSNQKPQTESNVWQKANHSLAHPPPDWKVKRLLSARR